MRRVRQREEQRPAKQRAAASNANATHRSTGRASASTMPRSSTEKDDDDDDDVVFVETDLGRASITSEWVPAYRRASLSVCRTRRSLFPARVGVFPDLAIAA